MTLLVVVQFLCKHGYSTASNNVPCNSIEFKYFRMFCRCSFADTGIRQLLIMYKGNSIEFKYVRMFCRRRREGVSTPRLRTAYNHVQGNSIEFKCFVYCLRHQLQRRVFVQLLIMYHAIAYNSNVLG